MNRSILGVWEEGEEEMPSRQREQHVQRIVCSRLSKYVWYYWQICAKGVGRWCGGKGSRDELKSKREAGTRAGQGEKAGLLEVEGSCQWVSNRALVRSNCSFKHGEGGFEGSTTGKGAH